MGKYLEALKLLYGEGENISDSLEGGTDKTYKRGNKETFDGFDGSTSRDIENIQASNEQDSVPFTDHELAEHKINGLRLRDDQVFIHQKLIGIYGKKRLELVNQYFYEWSKGMDAEPVRYKKENKGRYRANTWLREHSQLKS